MIQIEECDYDDPESVVSGFIASMNFWEIQAWTLSKKSKDGQIWAEILRAQEAVFASFCTPKDRPFGRNGSFQKPPEYDPQNESIVASDFEREDRAHVETQREALLGGGRYRYTLYRRGGRWLIDNIKFYEAGTWTRSIL